MGNIQSSINLLHYDSGASVTGGGRRSAFESTFSNNVISVTTIAEAISVGDIITPRAVAFKNYAGSDLLISIDGGLTYPFRLSPDNDVMLLRLDFESNIERTTIVCEADTAGSLSGDYIVMQDYAGVVWPWFSLVVVTAVTEVSTVTTVADVARSLNSKYFTLADAAGSVGVIIGVSETATGSITFGVPVNLDTVIVNGTTLTYVSGAPGAFEFNTIAQLEVLVEAVALVTSTENGTVVSISADTAGTAGNSITLALGGGNAGTMTRSGATLTGGLAGADTPPVTGAARDITVIIPKNSATGAVATAIQTAVHADAALNATVLTNVVTITDAATGSRANIAAATSTFAVAVTTEGVTGVAASTPPAVTTQRLLPVSYPINASATTIATALAAALQADASFNAAVPTTATVIAVDQHAGVRSTGAGVGTTGWASVTDDGLGAAYFDVYVKSAGTSQASIGVIPN